MIEAVGKYYLYRHVRLDSNEVFYVGKGTKKGKNLIAPSAYFRSIETSSRTNYWYNITESTKYDVEILLETNDLYFINQKEEEFIKLYGRKDLGLGTLVNVTNGGTDFKNNSHKTFEKGVATKRQRGNLSNCDNFKEWRKLGLSGMAKKAYLYNAIDGRFIKEYKSMVDCQKDVGIRADFIGKNCTKNKSFKNYIVTRSFLGESIDLEMFKKGTQIKSIAKVCPTSKNIIGLYTSVTEAAKNNNSSLKEISEALRTKGKRVGFYWIYQHEIGNINNIKFTKQHRI